VPFLHTVMSTAPFDDVTNISMCAALTLGGGGCQPAKWKQILEAGRLPDPVRIELPHAVMSPPREMLVVGPSRSPAQFP